MPPKPKFTKDEIVQAALGVVSRRGVEALTAKELGDALGSSARPIFTAFNSMKEVQDEVRAAAMRRFESYAEQRLPDMPLFKQVGMQMVLFGVREPKGGAVCVPKEGDLLLVPGLLFDGKKNRLGYGGGYYDTYFAKHKEGKRIGLAFVAQRFAEELPTEETDVPLDAVITENGWEE